MYGRTILDPYGFIYVTTNWVNGKRYVGQRKFKNKWQKYLGSGTILKRAIKKYGKESFSVSIIDIAYSKEELNNKEKQWIFELNACSAEDYYNMTYGGDGGNTICNYNELQMQELSRRHKEANRISPNTIRGEKSCSAILKEWQVKEIVNKLLQGEYNIDIAREYNVKPEVISSIRQHSTWRYLTEGIVFPNNRKITKHVKRVCRYSLKGEYLDTFESAREAESKTGTSYKKISQCCLGNCISSNGYLWCFEGDEKHILDAIQRYQNVKSGLRRKAVCAQSIETGEILYFDCLKTAIEELHIDRCIENMRIKAKSNAECAGYIWKYAEVI